MGKRTAIKPRDLDGGQLLGALRAFRQGNFSVRLRRDLTGVDGEIADTFNDVVELNERMSKEIERLSQIVGKQGKIGHRAKLPNATGSWAANIDMINNLIGDMVQPTGEMARVIGAVAKGDLSQRMNLDIDSRPLRGEFLRVGKVVNTMLEQLGSFASEVTRVAREVGTEGKLGGQANVRGVAGTWKDLTDNVNTMADNLTGQVRNIAEVTTAVAKGDLSKKITVNVKGEILELKNTVNTMMDQLNSFASEVTRVAREVGIEGKLGGQARVPGAAGVWRDLTDNVNQLADNLTTQVRAIAETSDAVTKGDLTRSITVKASGEVAALKDNINQMIRNLVQARKMEAVGQLTGGIAHDFNNLLTVVLGNIDLLSRRLDGNDRLHRHLSATRYAAERGQNLTQQLLAFSRRQHLQPQTLDVNALVRQFEPLIRRAMGESIALDVELCREPLVCEIDPSQLESALLNLAVNSRDAMPSGGTLAVTLKRVERDDDLIRLNRTASPGPWIVLSLEDSGVGMSQEVVDRAFEPFFTTKEPGKGTGLGLSRVYGFVQQSGGFVTLASTVGVGTRLSIYLPPSPKSLSEQVAVDQRLAASAARTGTILLVEDDSGVLALVIEMLNDLGYRVITASDAHGALEIVRRGEPIDLILTDIVMPGGKTGVHLAAEARTLRPDIKVLLMSGYPDEALAHHEPMDIEWPMIEKPFRQPELASRLQSLLEGQVHVSTGNGRSA